VPADAAIRDIYPAAGPLSVRHEPHLRSWFLDRWLPLSNGQSPRLVSGFVPVDPRRRHSRAAIRRSA
jgi:hypothetical protein